MDNLDNKSQAPIASQERELIRLLQANLTRSEEIMSSIKSIKGYIRWQQLWSVLRFLIIVIPIPLGFIYLPPLIKDALESYKSLLN